MKLRACLTLLATAVSLPALADVGFTSDRYSTTAGNASVSLVVQRDVAGPDAVVVGYRTVSGTAQPGADYTEVTSGTATIPAGSEGPATISIPLIFNGNSQTRSFAVELTSTSADVLSGFVRAEVQVLAANDPANAAGIVRFPVSADTVSADNLYALAISRESGSKGAASVRVVTRDGAGFDPIDQMVSWADGEVGVKTIPVKANIDFIDRDEAITVPIDMVDPIGVALQNGGQMATIYFLAPGTESPVGARFIDASRILGAGTSGVSIAIAVPPDPNDPDAQEGYSVFVRGVTTDVLQGRDFIFEGSPALTFDESGVAVINIEFPNVAIRDRLIEVRLNRFGLELDRVVYTLLGSDNDPYYRETNDQRPGTFSFFGSQVTFAPGVSSLTTQVARTGAAPLLNTTLQYRLRPDSGISGQDVASGNEFGTLNWDENELGLKVVTIPLLLQSQEADRGFTLEVLNLQGTLLASQRLVVQGVNTPDAAPSSIGFLTDFAVFPQDAPSLVAFVERTGSGDGAVTVQYRIEDGNTVIGLDYPIEAAVGSLSWADGEVGTKLIVIDLVDRNLFLPRSLTLRLSGQDVTEAASAETIIVQPLPITRETNGFVHFERSGTINTDTNNGSVSVRVVRDLGTLGPVTARVRITFPDESTQEQIVSWAAGSSTAVPATILVPTTSAGTITLEITEISGTVLEAAPLSINVASAGSGGGGGGSMNLPFLAGLMLLIGARALRSRRKALAVRG